MENKKTLTNVRPKMRTRMGNFKILGTVLFVALFAAFFTSCSKDTIKDQPGSLTSMGNYIAGTIPADLEDTVVINPEVVVNFKSITNSSVVSSAKIFLKQGTTLISGTVTISGTTATFTPSADLLPETRYIATVRTEKSERSGSFGDDDDDDDDDDGEDGDDYDSDNEHSWSFTTGKGRRNAPRVVSVIPVNSQCSY